MKRWFSLVVVALACFLILLLNSPAFCGDVDLPNAPPIVKALYLEMLRHLPLQNQLIGVAIALKIDPAPGVQALATYDEMGQPVIRITVSALDALSRVSYYIAATRLGQKQDLIRTLRAAEKTGALHCYNGGSQMQLPLPPSWQQNMRDPRFFREFFLSLRSCSCLVLGHELGHHCLGHISRALSRAGITPQQVQFRDLHDLINKRRNELEADTFGIYAVGWNQLDYESAFLFCRYMGFLEDNDVSWPYLRDHPNWGSRERNLRLIVESL